MMPEILLDLIDSNPFRDFDLHPIDPAQVERLQASIGADSFWASVTARPAGDRYQLAFGHHRIEAARALGLATVPIDVRDLSDWQMVRMLASENATQRGTTAAASLDAIAALCRIVTETCNRCESPEKVGEILPTSLAAAKSIWGKIRHGGVPGRDCIQSIMPKDTYSRDEIDLALGVLRDAGRLGGIAPVFDAHCANLFKRDYHLAEFRRIVTDPTVLSYLPVARQFEFGQRIVGELGAGELTAVRLRERANIIFYEELGIPRSSMRNSRLRISDDRIRDALNMMRRGTHDIKRSCALVADLIDEGIDISPEVIARFADYVREIDAALKSVVPQSGKRSNLRLIVDREENVA